MTSILSYLTSDASWRKDFDVEDALMNSEPHATPEEAKTAAQLYANDEWEMLVDGEPEMADETHDPLRWGPWHTEIKGIKIEYAHDEQLSMLYMVRTWNSD